ncbi:MAG: hypothetical protein ACW98I_04455 [Candidatus Hodarchaeales archaeon]
MKFKMCSRFAGDINTLLEYNQFISLWESFRHFLVDLAILSVRKLYELYLKKAILEFRQKLRHHTVHAKICVLFLLLSQKMRILTKGMYIDGCY